MATVELSRGSASGPAQPGADSPRRDPERHRAAFGLLAALLLLLLYGAFAHGGVGLPTEAREQVAIVALAALAGAAWLWDGSLRVAAPRRALAGVGLLAAFALWTGVTVLWSIAPNQTWLELNRGIAYTLVLVLAIAFGASHPRALELVAKGFLAVALAVTVYALGQKLVPGLHIGGIFDLNQTSTSPRLRSPLDYWNALALFVAFAVPIALALASQESRGERSRLGALIAIELMLLTIGLTYSRGGVIALALGLVVGIALGGARLRSLMLLAAASATTLPALIFGLSNHALTATAVPLGDRELAGAELTALLLASLVLLSGIARVLIRLEPRLRPSPARVRAIGRGLAILAALALALGLLALALSARGLTGSISHEWNSFAAPHGTSLYDPNRLLSADSGNRWVWWKEAAGAFSDRPLGGWGAGSFPALHLLYRRDSLPVLQPHSVPLQFLAETGLVGALMALGAFALLLSGAIGTVKNASPANRRLAAALLAAAVTYAVHALYDWDWDFPGVTLPALVFLGVLAGAGTGARSGTSSRGVAPTPEAPPVTRALALAFASFLLATVALSAVLPSLAESKSRTALVGAAGGSEDTLRSALASAELATRLDPLSDDGLKVAATIALHRGQPLSARGYLLDALRRVPSDAQAWEQLAEVELTVGDSKGLVLASSRALALDPRGARARTLAVESYEFVAPPSASATAIVTPLPGR